MIETHELAFQPGLIVNQEFFDYPAMQESAKNWLFLARYRFDTGDFYGRHDGIQLNNMQFGHADRHEGMMFQGVSPKDCLTIAILQKNSGSVCINNHKMESGDIILIDDTKPYDFSSSHHTVMAIISISKSLLAQNSSLILLETDKKFEDNNNILSKIIENEWQSITDSPDIYQESEKLRAVEEKVLNTMKQVFKGQVGEVSKLTKGEQTALEIKSFLLDSLAEDITIESLVSQFNISYKTLENSFKSLFGMTPKHFLMLLKLNHAHEDLLRLELKTTNVSDIAMKWGFSHFGRFSQSYKGLFDVLPSETLNLTPVQL